MPDFIDDSLVAWTQDAETRLSRVERKVDSINGPGIENSRDTISINTPPPPPPLPLLDPPAPVIPAKIVGSGSSSGSYHWVQQDPVGDGTWSDAAGGLNSTNRAVAFEATLNVNVPSNTSHVVFIYELASPAAGHTVYEFSDGSVGLGTLKYQVYQMTATNAAGWDFVRAHG